MCAYICSFLHSRFSISSRTFQTTKQQRKNSAFFLRFCVSREKYFFLFFWRNIKLLKLYSLVLFHILTLPHNSQCFFFTVDASHTCLHNFLHGLLSQQLPSLQYFDNENVSVSKNWLFFQEVKAFSGRRIKEERNLTEGHFARSCLRVLV